MGVQSRVCWAVAAVLLVLAAVPAAQAQAPRPKKTAEERVSRHGVAKLYRDARHWKMLQAILRDLPPVEARPAAPLPTAYDTVAQWLARFDPDYTPPVPEPEPLRVRSVTQFKRLQRSAFQRRFADTEWAYLGNAQFTPLDTSHTRVLRARLQSRYGAPTKTLVELDYSRNLKAEEYIQFEYWFAVNDTIPVIVMDAHGPFDRGLVLVSDQRHRDELLSLREQLLGDLVEEPLAPFVDYYYNHRVGRWYRTGFDGRHFFTDSIGQPNLARGRPQLPPPNR
ncbi:MAG: hypothetical protein R3247_13805 [Rhodothermales bacterium]|nr:hypothetical protein [Rhodothermales bacterium]